MNQEVRRLSKEEVRVVDSDDIPVAAWRRVGERAVNFLTRLLNTVLESERGVYW